ncbi:MAG: beta-ketoacyl-[acyl-carrier-protein] synthase II [Verrucomicrobia bacterium]|jgi:3-oxoacyl-[acyl-carrier-protein] synthase II|nr:MAG: beta-ketoacyl-[acyl-carrier-protein] synthase II [Verrucomicrobia bacterium 13_2_20CM_54_12]OLB43949.1 MAG: beta-ketoacyl-[acyl-carrier-protein] synthase II [Verrucomicrobia bacterium 13_2_20CM_2_54_15]OLD72272.1 MAG: beta-ketoacyl-[acyl-carrier-protein] synthase II [Verrucomicrobia bacterium 13_1_20CM_54_28]OLD85447.1 MAG: beta-ketoacyl-[acyl-carrier-protein] synthase II [Verrucomicrobia bacterium 13_1_20CM_4_54_11]PYK16836.1 MAG: beta-ketoacyl-[acyl-carrier-protein] synthase II [Verru
MTDRRVVITGIGVLTPVGNDVETFWSNLKHGVSGIHTIDAFDTAAYDCKIGGQVRGFDPKPFFKNPKDVRRTDRFSQLAVAASKMALEDSGIDVENLKQRDRFGVLVSSGIGGLKTLQDQLTILLTKGPSRNSPFTIPMLLSNMASGLISMEFGLHGPNMCIVTACATANNAIGESWRIIKFGDADIFLAGGSEASIVEIGLAGFSAMRALSTRNDEPERASRPFDRDRDGFVVSEGAGIVVVEELEHAKARGAKIYCELTGYGLSADAYHMTAPPPDGQGAARAMQLALEHARLSPDQVDYINAHATSTDIGDICETRAIKQVFGEHAHKVAISSTKSMTGHLLGGAGGIEMAACALAIRDSVIPPTINLENPGEECDLDYTPNVAREKKVRIALNNSFGFGGHNATLVAAAFEP